MRKTEAAMGFHGPSRSTVESYIEPPCGDAVGGVAAPQRCRETGLEGAGRSGEAVGGLLHLRKSRDADHVGGGR